MAESTDYYRKFIKTNNNNQDYISEMSNSLSNQRNNAVSPFQILINSNQAKDITLNGISYKAVIDVKVLRDKVIKTIQMNQGIMKYGDYFNYYNESTKRDDIYIIKSRVEPTLKDYDSAFMQDCNSSLKFKTTINGVEQLIEIPSIIGNGSLGVQEDKYINTEKDQITCEVGYSLIDKVNYIKDTGTTTRFILNGRVFKTVGIDNITNVIGEKQGVIVIKLISTQKVTGDDFVLGVALNK